jgi:cytochrome c oxidase subunit 4
LWIALLLLVALTLWVAFLSIDASIKTAINLAIAGIQVVIISVFFMNLRASSALLRLTAAAAVYWLVIMFVLTFNDYQSRPASSPCVAPAFQAGNSGQCETQVR